MTALFHFWISTTLVVLLGLVSAPLIVYGDQVTECKDLFHNCSSAIRNVSSCLSGLEYGTIRIHWCACQGKFVFTLFSSQHSLFFNFIYSLTSLSLFFSGQSLAAHAVVNAFNSTCFNSTDPTIQNNLESVGMYFPISFFSCKKVNDPIFSLCFIKNIVCILLFHEKNAWCRFYVLPQYAIKGYPPK